MFAVQAVADVSETVLANAASKESAPEHPEELAFRVCVLAASRVSYVGVSEPRRRDSVAQIE